MTPEQLLKVIEGLRQQLVKLIARYGLDADVEINFFNTGHDADALFAVAKKLGWAEHQDNGYDWVVSETKDGKTVIFSE